MKLASRDMLNASNGHDRGAVNGSGAIYKIGDLAREFDVTLRTLRFYEDKGLLSPSRSGTTRLYSEEDRARLKTALFCKSIGLSLVEIRTVLELQANEGRVEGDDRRIRDIYAKRMGALQDQLTETQTAIHELQARLDELDRSAGR